jgi:hypothetical protein
VRNEKFDQVITMAIYTVGLKLRTRAKTLTTEAEDALLAALKIKLENPEAAITYVRKSNRRGDRRPLMRHCGINRKHKWPRNILIL